MADAAAPIDPTSTAPATDSVASPSSSPVDASVTAPASAGDTAAAPEKTSARDVWREMQAAESGGTPPDAPQDPSHAQAATQPDGSPEAPGSLPARGYIPPDRHQAVVTNTRNKTRTETLAEFGIAEGTPKDDVATGVNLIRMLKQDPHALVRIVQSQLGDPTPSARAPEPKPVDDPEPEPDIPLQDGRFVFSANQLRQWQQWNTRQMDAKLEARYGPIREAHELQTLKTSQTREAQHLVGEAKSWPLFDQLRPHIKAIIAADTRPLGPTSLHNAYIAAYRQHGETLLRAQWDAERTGQLTRKANASTVQPGAPRPTTPRPDSELTTREIVRQEYRKAAAG